MVCEIKNFLDGYVVDGFNVEIRVLSRWDLENLYTDAVKLGKTFIYFIRRDNTITVGLTTGIIAKINNIEGALKECDKDKFYLFTFRGYSKRIVRGISQVDDNTWEFLVYDSIYARCVIGRRCTKAGKDMHKHGQITHIAELSENDIKEDGSLKEDSVYSPLKYNKSIKD